MGKHFGELAFIRGIVFYKLSPHELKPLAGAISRGLPNILPRTLHTAYTWLPTFVIGYLVYESIEHQYHHLKRKKVSDFDHEEDPNPPLCKFRPEAPKVCE